MNRIQILEFVAHSNAIENEYEVNAIEDGLEAWDYLVTQDKVSAKVIMKVHALAMRTRPMLDRYKGQWRDCDIWVGGRKGAAVASIPYLIDAWCNAVNASVERGETQENIQEFHVEYEKIHPHIDGNGRSGRLLYNWHRIKCGYPLHIIRKEDVMDYYAWFKHE